MSKHKKIIVTGGYGFIGAHMVRRLVNDGHQVILLVKKGSNPSRVADLLPKMNVHEDDLSDKARLTALIHEIQPHGIFHFAASNIQSGVTAGDEEVLRVNILGTANLLEAANKIDYDFFINIGTFLEYGMKGRPLKEDDFPEPPNLYAISKLGATLYGQAVAKRDTKPIITLRLMTPYGPLMQNGRLMYEVVRKALAGEPIELTRPTVGRDFIYIDDVIDLCLEVSEKAREHRGEIFNMGSGVQTTLQELADSVLRKTNSKSKINWGAFKQVAYDSDVWLADMTKTFATFGWRPKISLTSGIDKMIEWCRTIKNNSH